MCLLNTVMYVDFCKSGEYLTSLATTVISGNAAYCVLLVLSLLNCCSVIACIVSLQHLHFCLQLFGVALRSCKYPNGVKTYFVFHIVTSVHKLGWFLYL